MLAPPPFDLNAGSFGLNQISVKAYLILSSFAFLRVWDILRQTRRWHTQKMNNVVFLPILAVHSGGISMPQINNPHLTGMIASLVQGY